MAWPKSRPVEPGSDASPRLTVKPRPPRPVAAGNLPEGRGSALAAGTGSGPEGSSLTADARRLEGLGVEDNGGPNLRGSRRGWRGRPLPQMGPTCTRPGLQEASAFGTWVPQGEKG